MFSSYKVVPCMKLGEAPFKDLHPHPSPKKKKKKPNLPHSRSVGVHSCSGMPGFTVPFLTNLPQLSHHQEARSLPFTKLMPSTLSFKALLKLLFISSLAINKTFHSSKPHRFTILENTGKLLLSSSFLEHCTPQLIFTINEISLKFNTN